MDEGRSITQEGPRQAAGERGGRSAGDGAVRLIEEARGAVVSDGWHLMAPAAVCQSLGTDASVWQRFAAHWEDLAVDAYAAQTGTRRLRRYGQFLLSRSGEIKAMPHDVFVQPQDSNPLYVEVDRRFEPLTEEFRAEPVLGSLIRMLGQVAAGLDDAQEWTVRVHPFRVVAQADSLGQPTPEGRHKDGVTLVTSLLIGRENVTGGQSTVYDADGRQTVATTLSEPGTLLLSDDRATWHAVSPVHPLDPGRAGHRDVLVTTLAAR
ncbi:2OG-Fe dioxygenase family protein [Streptomyces sp. ISL-94]|uniref:2OG-Fe dioxygenase family protein n=1 Tax=Streptomyces sp. ISL-94 TaxID=2819190 RepID=UPI001BE91A47|nr:2OG-Fe dioxygenase family protein [Streptomyces sp. ISL-94]MBT2482348.1 2OG-Fe dioxygenase family protein [Streptomyces sp. ISL-94]